MSKDYSLKLTLGYEATDFERVVTVKGVDSAAAAVETVRSKVQAVNQSLEGGTDGGLSTFMISDDFDATESVGKLAAVKQVIIKEDDETTLI